MPWLLSMRTTSHAHMRKKRKQGDKNSMHECD
jgi:hypothetical protein